MQWDFTMNGMSMYAKVWRIFEHLRSFLRRFSPLFISHFLFVDVDDI